MNVEDLRINNHSSMKVCVVERRITKLKILAIVVLVAFVALATVAMLLYFSPTLAASFAFSRAFLAPIPWVLPLLFCLFCLSLISYFVNVITRDKYEKEAQMSKEAAQ
jgi:hypothetical protein